MIKMTSNLARLACLAVATVAAMGFAPSVNAETTIYSSTGQSMVITGDVLVCQPGDTQCTALAERPRCDQPGIANDCATACTWLEDCEACCRFRPAGVQQWDPQACIRQKCEGKRSLDGACNNPDGDARQCRSEDKNGRCPTKQACYRCCDTFLEEGKRKGCKTQYCDADFKAEVDAIIALE